MNQSRLFPGSDSWPPRTWRHNPAFHRRSHCHGYRARSNPHLWIFWRLESLCSGFRQKDVHDRLRTGRTNGSRPDSAIPSKRES